MTTSKGRITYTREIPARVMHRISCADCGQWLGHWAPKRKNAWEAYMDDLALGYLWASMPEHECSRRPMARHAWRYGA